MDESINRKVWNVWNSGTERGETVKYNISIRLDAILLNKIDKYAKSRKITRTKAITTLLENTKVIQLDMGADIIKELHSIECFLGKSSLSNQEKFEIERCCNKLWQLLNLITEKIQR